MPKAHIDLESCAVILNDDVYLVPFVEEEQGYYLKTIIPSRKATRDFLSGRS